MNWSGYPAYEIGNHEERGFCRHDAAQILLHELRHFDDVLVSDDRRCATVATASLRPTPADDPMEPRLEGGQEHRPKPDPPIQSTIL